MSELVQFGLGVAEGFALDVHAVQQGDVEIRHRRFRGIDDVASGLDAACSVTGQDHRQMIVLMAVAVAQAAAVDDHGMIEQRAVAVFCGFQFAQEIGELLHVDSVLICATFSTMSGLLRWCVNG